MYSQLLKLNLTDLSKGLVVAVLVAVLQIVLDLIKVKGLDLSMIDFSAVLDIALKAGGAYLLKNLFTNENGATFGFIGGKKETCGTNEKGDL